MRAILSCLPICMQVTCVSAEAQNGARATPGRLTASECPVLLVGEPGSGKRMLARWLHDHGPRAGKPFVDLNCVKLRSRLLQSELLGHEKRPSAAKRRLFEIAEGGTLFLDEIGEMDLGAQSKLLRVLEERQLSRLDGAHDRHPDVRLIAATRQNPARLVRWGRLRGDLHCRINSLTLEVPPLRRRRDGILALAECFLERLGRGLGRPGLALAPEAVEALLKYRWPGNLRELHNVLERAALCGEGEVLDRGDLHFEAGFGGGALGATKTLDFSLEELEERHLEWVLRREGSVSRAAERLGIERGALLQRFEEYGLGRPSLEQTAALI